MNFELRRRGGGAPWVLALAALVGLGVGAVIFLSRTHGELLVVIGIVALAAFPGTFFLVSALSPARLDRKCPVCGKEALVRLERGAPMGVQCPACGFRDELASTARLGDE